MIVDHIATNIQGRKLDPRQCEESGDHDLCFLEGVRNQATILDFDCDHPPVVKAPNALMHYLKMAFDEAYFHLVPTSVV